MTSIISCSLFLLAESRPTWTTRPYTRFDHISPAVRNSYYLGVLDGAAELAAPAGASGTVGVSTPLPRDYDWREDSSLAQCIGGVQDQGECGSCWAVSSIESLYDRRCIRASQSANTSKPRIALSSLDVVACDKMCEGIEKCCHGCTGGYPKLAFEYVQKKGVVSSMCMPYNVTKSLLCPLPPCQKPLEDRKFKAKETKQLYGGALAMQAEIFMHGPVAATFTVYEDFFNYGSGVYQLSNTSGKRAGLHAVKVVGWGVLNGTTEDAPEIPYWSAQNSWGEGWGMHGSFMIAQGQCGFEQSVFTATPCLDGEICVTSSSRP